MTPPIQLSLPPRGDAILDCASSQSSQDLDFNQLLGRAPAPIDCESVRTGVARKVVLVTGAAGSIGSELTRQILRFGPAKLICLDQSETGLFHLNAELDDNRVSMCLADYVEPNGMRRVFATHKVQVVFHAAAYKHVPFMETNPREALQNNVFGLKLLLDVAEAARCEAFILISSDKAVNPTSVMGCTKRIGELMLSSRPASCMRCVSVRFGNVLGSQGSVVPVFQKLLAENKPITLTHPDITRFFMTIREAVSLVLQASAIGQNRDILVFDMGEPIRILDLAQNLARLSGKSEDDVKVTVIGLRPGEKLYEELFYEDEVILDTTCAKIKQTRSPDTTNRTTLTARLEDIGRVMFEISDLELRSKLRDIVPQYACETDFAPVLR